MVKWHPVNSSAANRASYSLHGTREAEATHNFNELQEGAERYSGNRGGQNRHELQQPPGQSLSSSGNKSKEQRRKGRAAPDTYPNELPPGAIDLAAIQSALSEATTESTKEQARRSSNLVSILVIVSRITGFFRTTVQAWALGAAGLASAYTVANNLPNLLYEFVMGGMLITAFLPVYMAVKTRIGQEGANEYASNLLSLALLLMTLLTILSLVFAAPIIWTQSAGASEGFDSSEAVWFFRWFACCIILYALSSIFSGILNAERNYLWSYVAPIFNNVITISSFVIYAVLVSQGVSQNNAMIALAAGPPLGVGVQAFCQLPALYKCGVRFRFKINLRDPALRATLKIGLPTFATALAGAVASAVASSSALSVTPAGASIAYYANVWYVLPFSILAIPLTTTLYTEMSNSYLNQDIEAFKDFLADGTRKVLFTLIPCMLFLIVFAQPLIAVFTSGQFTQEASLQTAAYLQVLALALPFYGLSSHLRKACSAMMSMKFYAIAVCVGSAVQAVVCIVFTPISGLLVVPLTTAIFYVLLDAMSLVYIRSKVGGFGGRSILFSTFRALALGALGSVVGLGAVTLLTELIGPCEGIVRGILYAAAGGVPAVIVTYGGASLLGIREAPFFDAIFTKLFRRR